MSKQIFLSNSSSQTQKFAAEIAKKLTVGSIVALYGDLGAGKTTFVQGLAKGLGYKGKVFSPTFIFVRPYKLENKQIVTLNHIDLYRIEKPTDLKTVGLEDFLSDKKAVSVIEWPEKLVDSLPKKALKIFIKKLSESEREFTWNE